MTPYRRYVVRWYGCHEDGLWLRGPKVIAVYYADSLEDALRFARDAMRPGRVWVERTGKRASRSLLHWGRWYVAQFG